MAGKENVEEKERKTKYQDKVKKRKVHGWGKGQEK